MYLMSGKVDMLKMEVKNMTAYISDILSELRFSQKWTLNQKKFFLTVIAKLADSKIYVSKQDQIVSFDDERILLKIDSVSPEIIMGKDEFIDIMKIDKRNYSREVAKVCDGVMSTVATLPNPFEVSNKKSFRKINWFNYIDYKDSNGEIKIHIHQNALPYLIVFTNYTKINLHYIFQFKSQYSLQLYYLIKMNKARYKHNDSINYKIDELIIKLEIPVGYSNISMMKKAVLDVAIEEINSKTDLLVSYELKKTGKKFTDIDINFSQKKVISKQPEQSNPQDQRIKHQATDESLNLDINDQDIIIAAHLQSYGIPRNKAIEYVKSYGVNTCKIGIEKLLGEIQKGRDIKNTSGYLVACIENTGNNSSSQEIKSAMSAAEEFVQDRKAQEMKRFNLFDTYINNNEQQITVLLARHEANEKLTDELEIDMLRCLKDVVDQYKDLESMSPYYLTLRFKGDMLNYANIKSLVDELEVATKEERITKLKADLEAKKLELENVSEKAKELVEKEITMLKVAIADLV